MKMRVAILGGGVNGICCAVQILEHFKNIQQPIQVTVISEQFTPHTTGDGSAGLWGPYLIDGTSVAKVHKWSKSMHDFLEKIWLSEDAGEAGVCLIPAVRLTAKDSPSYFWHDIVYGYNELTPEQLEGFNRGRTDKYTSGLSFVTYTSEPVKLLPYLMKRFEAQGGILLQQKVERMAVFIEKSDYDVIVNCTGLGSEELLNDKTMFPVRGQVSRVRANWLYCVVMADGNYIIPNSDTVVLGGTHQQDYSTLVSAEDKDHIINGCRKIVPGLEHTEHLYDWVGLRPGRKELRLEAERQGKKIVIHNYGHGGSGVTLSWGCAEDVLDILKNELKNRKANKSKL